MPRLTAPLEVAQALNYACIRLLQQAEGLAPEQVEQVAMLAYQCGCHSEPQPHAVLAFVIERVCDELITGRVAVGIALPALCAAADVLLSAVASGTNAAVTAGLAAAHFELDTLLPMAKAPAVASPQLIGASALIRNRGTIAIGIDPLVKHRQRRAARGPSPAARQPYDQV